MPNPLLANVVVDTFIHGGWIMWPLLIASLAAVAVVAERLIWWNATRRARTTEGLSRVYAALAKGDFASATQASAGSRDPRLRAIHYGLEHVESDLEVAIQVRAAEEVDAARRNLAVLDTVITLAPLLGLLGTVVGIMQSFSFVGADQALAVDKVSGGIGEALIATAYGLGIAIFALVPFNSFNRRAEQLGSELETVGKQARLLVEKARIHGRSPEFSPAAAI